MSSSSSDENCGASGVTGKHCVFGVIIIGTGVGGGLVIDGKLVEGAVHIAGELGHTPLPWPRPDEYPGADCWCGRPNCPEVWVSGTGIQRDFAATGFPRPPL